MKLWRRRQATLRIQESVLTFRQSFYGTWEPNEPQRDLQAARERLRQALQAPGVDARQTLDLWCRLRRLGELPGPEAIDQVLGVLIETGGEITSSFLTGYADGYAQILYSDGEAIHANPAYGNPIERRAKDPVAPLAKTLVAAAQPLVEEVPLEESRSLPGPGRVRLVLLTPGGVRAWEETEAALQARASRLWPIHQAGKELAAALREIGPEMVRAWAEMR